MFASTALVYPCVLALLCTGAGLLADRLSGGRLPAGLLPALGVATLIAVSQLTTYVSALAPATPYAIAAVALVGFAVGWPRLAALARDGSGGRGGRGALWQIGAAVFVFAAALAPVLAAGRPTFSSFQALTDSAFHMMGADYLMRHGQSYGGLDLSNSYGQYLHAYYGTGYPSGADTLFGASSLLVGLPLIWTFQPFCAFVLATAVGPAFTLARRIGLTGGWAALACTTVTLGALVYGYELVASVKELVALAMILTLGALTVEHARWLWRGPAGVCAFALALAAGISALGVGFCAWGLVAVLVVAAVAIADVRAGRRRASELASVTALGAAVVGLAALSTWAQLSASLNTAHGIATTSNPGNLTGSLDVAQAFGTWLVGSYQETPAGAPLALTYAVVAITLALAVLGMAGMVARRERVLAAWLALSVAVGVGLYVYATAWVGAKAIMLTSPVVVLLAWAGIAGLRTRGKPAVATAPAPATIARTSTAAGPATATTTAASRPHPKGGPALAAALAAIALVVGVGVSDAMQYHASNLAPTARYEELASIGRRFAGEGPTLVDGFDEYALYELRQLDVGGLDFMYPPAGMRTMKGHGYPVDLDRVPATAWARYPLVVTPRDPTVSEPPSAYRLVWQGTYYQVWQRTPGAPSAIAHLGLTSTRPAPCRPIGRIARTAAAAGASLIAAIPPETVHASVAGGTHTSGWHYTHPGLVMNGAGRWQSTFALPWSGAWEVWLKGQVMPAITVAIDGRRIATIEGQLNGNPHNPEPAAPVRVWLPAGRHTLTIARGGGIDLAPGAGGWAILHEAFLTPAGHDTDRLLAVPASRWRGLCGGRYDWIEAVR